MNESTAIMGYNRENCTVERIQEIQRKSNSFAPAPVGFDVNSFTDEIIENVYTQYLHMFPRFSVMILPTGLVTAADSITGDLKTYPITTKSQQLNFQIRFNDLEYDDLFETVGNSLIELITPVLFGSSDQLFAVYVPIRFGIVYDPISFTPIIRGITRYAKMRLP